MMSLRKYGVWLETGAAVLLGLVFLASGLGKAAYPYQFLRAVEAYRLISTHTALYVALILPSVELLVGLCLLSGVVRGGAFLCAAGMGGLFVFVNASVILRNMVIPCGCFGGGANGETVGVWTLLRAIAVLLTAAVGFAAAMASQGAGQRGEHANAVEVRRGHEAAGGQS